MKSSAPYYIVLLERATLLAKRRTQDWRDLNAEFGDMKACLGPWTFEEACAWMIEEWGPDALSNPWLSAFPSSDATTISV